MTKNTTPRSPSGLQAPGRRLWKALYARYTFTAAEAVEVIELCRLADDLERIRSELVDAPLVIPGSKGQAAISPLRAELHRTSTRFESLLRSLNLPADDATLSSEQQRTWAGRSLARQRWGA